MRGDKPVQLRGRTIPLIVVALILPTMLGFLLLGPGLGLALGALSVAALIVVAANLRFDEPIEIASPADDRYRVLLVLATSAVDEPVAASGVAVIAEHGRSEGSGTEEPEVLILAPAAVSWVNHWLSDVGVARLAAQTRLALSVGTLAAAGIEARAQVGDPDTVLAIEDVLRVFPAQEVLFAADEDPAIAEVRRRLDRPVRTLS
ncbi:hypothetical protein BH10ACT11_BH10ACT11_12970 [soil metagenome]